MIGFFLMLDPCLKLKKNEVLTILSGDVFAGIEAYEEFVKTGMKWFDDEEKLF